MDAALQRLIEQVQTARTEKLQVDIRGGGTKAFYGGTPQLQAAFAAIAASHAQVRPL